MTTKCIYLQQSVSEVMGRQLEIKRPNQNENIVEIQPNRNKPASLISFYNNV